MTSKYILVKKIKEKLHIKNISFPKIERYEYYFFTQKLNPMKLVLLDKIKQLVYNSSTIIDINFCYTVYKLLMLSVYILRYILIVIIIIVSFLRKVIDALILQ